MHKDTRPGFIGLALCIIYAHNSRAFTATRGYRQGRQSVAARAKGDRRGPEPTALTYSARRPAARTRTAQPVLKKTVYLLADKDLAHILRVVAELEKVKPRHRLIP